MKRNILINIISATLLLATAATAFGQATATSPKSADALVADLYKSHDQKRGPFFQTKSRALLDKYFEKSLADMIWKDRVSSKGEVGVLDGDPLYDAQDMQIKNFAIGKAESEGAKAKVTVTFENLGQKKTLVFMLGKGSTGWRINDIDYGSEGTLRGWFKKGSK
jgi:hypothetical protein